MTNINAYGHDGATSSHGIMVTPMIISRSYRMSTVANLKFREESKMEGFPFMKLVLVLVAPLILEMNL